MDEIITLNSEVCLQSELTSSIVGDEVGDIFGKELNGDSGFDNPSSWVVTGGGWSVAGSKTNCNGTQTNVAMLFRSDIIPKNTMLRAEFTISNYVAGNVRIRHSMTEYTEYVQGNGKHILYYETLGTAFDYSCLFADVNFQADVDDFSIKKKIEIWRHVGILDSDVNVQFEIDSELSMQLLLNSPLNSE